MRAARGLGLSVRRRMLTPGCVALACTALALALPAGARAALRTPRSNIAWGQLPDACADAPKGEECESAWLYYLDRARSRLGLPAYAVPRAFLRFPATRQIFALSNLDRTSYRLPVATGMVAQLDSAAARAARRSEDPLLPAGPFQAPWGSNFAAAPNALEGYYLWMYDDGFGGGNLDCRRPAAAGCWGHRRNILLSLRGRGYKIAIGIAAGPSVDGGAYTTLIALARNDVHLAFSWSAARALGVGRSTYRPAAPAL
ncbi:MAG TPA: hypothetical protein VMA83_03570 [Solirubrobacteraceae bacterium]|nr:hypothetical protein [Solirubrobacteraceae bacterium]